MKFARLKPWIPHLVALALVALGAWYVVRNADDFAVLGRLSPARVALIALVFAAGCAVGGFQLNLFLRRYGVALPWYRWLGLYFAMSVGNIVTPLRGGTGMAALYLKTVHGFALARFAAVLVGTYVGAALVNAVLALAGMALCRQATGWFSPAPVVLAAAVLTGCVAALLVPNLRPSEAWPWRWVVRAVNGWHELFGQRSLLWKVLLTTLGQAAAQTIGFVLIYDALDLAPSGGAAAVLTIVSMSTIASMISITPASLGPFDAVLLALPLAFGLTVEQTAPTLVVFRGISLATSFLLAGVFAPALRSPRAP
jgi:uncharacterized membrane protein YbhN (UPF0104 family)